MKKAIFVLITIGLLACTKTSNQPQMATLKFADNYIAPPNNKATNAHHNHSNGKHLLVAFKQSVCKTTAPASEKILHKELRSDTLVLKIRGPHNCDTQYKGDFNFAENHLNLTTQQLPHVVKRKNGQNDTIYTTAECYCMYEFTYSINHIRAMPQTISLNGKIIN